MASYLIFVPSFIILESTEGNSSWEVILGGHVASARYAFFLSNNKSTIPSGNEISHVDLLISSILFIAAALFELLGFFSDGLIIMMCITLWIPANGLARLVRKCKDYENEIPKETEIIMESYQVVRTLSKAINEAMNLIVFFFVMIILLYYSVNLGKIVVMEDWSERFMYIVQFFHNAPVFWIAGDICYKVSIVELLWRVPSFA